MLTPRAAASLLASLALAACGAEGSKGSPGGAGDSGAPDDAAAGAAGVAGAGGGGESGFGSGGATADAAPPPPIDAGVVTDHGGDVCPNLECLECSSGTGCAAAGPFVDGTCCALGDNLVHLATGAGSEVVDIEVDGRYAILCGGFGARISDVTDPAAPVSIGGAGSRCQRIAFGATMPGGARVFYIAHHGDSWVQSPSLATYQILPDGSVEQKDAIQDPAILFEGLHYRDGFLYVAAHDGGLLTYSTDSDGVPTFLGGVGGFGNAWKLDSEDGWLYVADADAGVRVLSVADPAAPALVGTYPTAGSPRDVDVDAGRVYVALGGSGIDVFDVTGPGELTHVETIVDEGSAQAVSASNGLLAVANWSHVALRDSTTFRLIGTERTRDRFEQDLGVTLLGHDLFVGEWEGLHTIEYREGYIAADIDLREEVFTLPSVGPAARAVVVRNRGLVTLDVTDISIDDPAYSLDVTSLAVPPGKSDFFQLGIASPVPGTSALLRLVTNDPDPAQAMLERSVLVDGSHGLGVGDRLTDDFGFLDPSGAGQIGGVQGHVLVLAYFALF